MKFVNAENENWYWTELIGFDVNKKDFGVSDFIKKVSNDIYGVSLLLYDNDFINTFQESEGECDLPLSACSYAGHPYNEDRKIQQWTNFKLKGLISELHKNNIEVVFSVFNNYTYTDYRNGKKVIGEFSAKHPEISEFCSAKFKRLDTNNMLKRFNNGEFFEDYFISKCVQFVNYYGFDGMQVADGISSHRLTIQNGDYSDDMVGQFIERMKVRLPYDIKLKCDDDRKEHIKRYKYILNNLRYEYTCFISDRYAVFFKKIIKAFLQINKFIIFNNAWTKDHFEALFRYGIDYRKFYDDGIYAMMFEDVSCSLPLFSVDTWGGVRASFEYRKYFFYEYWVIQQNLKSYLPKLKQLNMTPIKDTEEQWNLIDSSPNDLKKEITKRNTSFIRTNNQFVRFSQGGFYCLSDGLQKRHWAMIKKFEDDTQIRQITDIFGAYLIHNDNIYEELDSYIKTRNMSSTTLQKRLLIEKFPVSSMVSVDELSDIKNPIIVANADFFDDEKITILETFTNAPMFLFGYKNALKRSPSQTIECKRSGMKCWIYNTDCGENIIIDKPVKKTSVSAVDLYDGIWPQELKYNDVSKAFFRTVLKIFEKNYTAPKVISKSDANIFCYKTGENKCTIVVYNNLFYCDNITIRMPFNITMSSIVGKPSWSNVVLNKNEFTVKVANRSCEIINLEF